MSLLHLSERQFIWVFHFSQSHPFTVTLRKDFFGALLLLVLGNTLTTSASNKPTIERTVPVPPGVQIPLSDFFRPSLMKAPQLNPSGTRIAVLINTEGDHERLAVIELQSQKTESFGFHNDLGVSVLDTSISDIHWLNNEQFTFGTISLRGDVAMYTAQVNSPVPWHGILQYSGSRLIDMHPAERLRPLQRLLALATLVSDGEKALNVSPNIWSGKIVALTTTATSNADHKQYFPDANKSENDPQDAGYLIDKTGHLAFGYTVNSDGIYSLRRLAGDHWETCPVNLDEVDIVGTGEQPGELTVIGPRNAGHTRPLQFMDSTTGRLGEILLKDEGYDFNGTLYRDPASRTIVGAVYDREGPQVTWFNPDYQKRQEALNSFFPGVVVRIIGNDEKGEIVLVSTYSDRQPPIYHWVDLSARKAGLIKNSLPWIDPARMQPMQIIKFKTRDGYRLDAYLTLPAGASKRNPPPLVVLPHDGPNLRSTWGFDPQVQFFASRGYAVLQPNYRGSSGYAWMFPREDDWAFDKMRDDVNDATKGLISTGLVDARRIAIVGSDFGGYLAASGVASEPNLYRCAVAVSGIYDWAEIIRDNRFEQRASAPYNSGSYFSTLYRLGDPKKEPEKLNSLSVLRHAGQIRVPLLVTYGEFDSGLIISQAKSLVSTLKRNGVECELLKFRDESFGIHRQKNLVELYAHIEAFLAKNLIAITPVAATP